MLLVIEIKEKHIFLKNKMVIFKKEEIGFSFKYFRAYEPQCCATVGFGGSQAQVGGQGAWGVRDDQGVWGGQSKPADGLGMDALGVG